MLVLVQRLGRRPNIVLTMGVCLVFPRLIPTPAAIRILYWKVCTLSGRVCPELRVSSFYESWIDPYDLPRLASICDKEDTLSHMWLSDGPAWKTVGQR